MTTPRDLPGDPPPRLRLERALRVDHAGEFGAKRMYEGQLAVLGRSPIGATLRRMAAAETEHLRYFEERLVERRVSPSLLLPLWNIAGFALGAGTALLGERAAMACTVAVEEEVEAHYERQRADLDAVEPELARDIARFQAEEREHREIGLAHGAERAPAGDRLTAIIRAGTRAAIRLAERF